MVGIAVLAVRAIDRAVAYWAFRIVKHSARGLVSPDVVRGGSLIGARVGHLTMLPEESVKINSEFEFWLAENLLEDFLGR